jgi:hypothetical protein
MLTQSQELHFECDVAHGFATIHGLVTHQTFQVYATKIALKRQQFANVQGVTAKVTIALTDVCGKWFPGRKSLVNRCIATYFCVIDQFLVLFEEWITKENI